MAAMTLEHLLSGAAAVEDASHASNSSSSSSSAESGSHSDSGSDSPRQSPPGDENEARADNTRRRGDAEPLPPAKFLKTEPPLTPIQPMPKLPPISSLTQPSGLPPSLQTQQAAAAQAARPPATGTAAAAGAQDEGLCRYRNKLCLNGRAVKRNGELHNLCEKHRAKANQNQRKLESKRRVQKRQTRHATTAPPRTYQLTPMGAAVLPSDTMHHQRTVGHVQGPVQALPSLAQLHRPPPPPPSSSSASYPYYDGHYPYQR